MGRRKKFFGRHIENRHPKLIECIFNFMVINFGAFNPNLLWFGMQNHRKATYKNVSDIIIKRLYNVAEICIKDYPLLFLDRALNFVLSTFGGLSTGKL